MDNQKVSLSLPKGDMLPLLSEVLESIRFPLDGYRSDNRTYRPTVHQLPVRAKIMAEKDVALQVAAGNYDIGFCGKDWILEYTARFSASSLQVLFSIESVRQSVFVCCGEDGSMSTLDDLQACQDFIEIVSEYPNLAESFAIQNRLKRFKIFSAWGSVEAYPPEHAHVAILKARDEKMLKDNQLLILEKLFDVDLCLVVNAHAYRSKDLTPALKYLFALEAS
ncbi:MAG: ATP phosphoribosyltransferase [Candidatus Magnetoglobus multicellularis str. Araruama]|uniref:ATP phosphoribosyltransferase n=1 Tax=Candidatus Magnetoglobus multicellularis str. Araruama TaxID=890399 RepID=A0A1V1PI89_9BACT|nr:MAG: ATP phosphoribosyltransferase [Candidatus Magnetoglobus multicellularis str. Araruama]